MKKNTDILIKECDHFFVRQKNSEGEEYPDGRAICLNCDHKEKKGFLESIPNKTVARMPMGEDYICKIYWGDVFTQCGKRGIVLSPDSLYRTAFFEAFPNVGEYGTFIRGEGENIIEAEKKAWEKYQRQLSCKNHEWTRFINNSKTERKNGYAQCIHCKLSTDALEPLTLCQICSEPTTNEYGDSYMCYSHYFKVDYDTLVKDEFDFLKKLLNDEGSLFEDDKEFFFISLTIEYKIKFFNILGEENYKKYLHRVEQVCRLFVCNVLFTVYTHHPFKLAQYIPKLDDLELLECKKYFESNFDDIILYILKKRKSLPTNCLLHEKYLNLVKK